MMRALFSAATGMTAQQTNVDVIANNLANLNTVGFKRTRADFADLLYQTLRAPGTTTIQGQQSPTGIQVGMGTRLAATTRMWTQGEFQQTGDPFSLAIEGDGFFQINTPDGIVYTRDGTFKLDATGKLVTSDGFALEPAITIPQNALNVSIGTDGTVTFILPGQTEAQQAGQITLAKFINPAGLQSIGNNMFRATTASGNAITGTPGVDGMGTVRQGFVESSNVKVVEELVNLIIAQRAYEVNSKAIQTSDEMLQTANSLRR
ncbi:MAG: flagellar basal-body rod protein FlgG [Abditibacteriales bacterium]|nr:flagellar basal-body rod protein FlgG [Abditibacteriales bacterium]MDW8364573.1 flagellar basal-body rod protein FlgG [Abditibacteriales bacterium]